MKSKLLVAALVVLGLAAMSLWHGRGALAAGVNDHDRFVVTVSAQDGEDVQDMDGAQNSESVDRQRVDIQVWTVLAAAGAAGLGLLLLVLRVAMGWVKPPPPPDEAHHEV